MVRQRKSVATAALLGWTTLALVSVPAAFSQDDWVQVATTGPSPRSVPSMAYRSVSATTILYGGSLGGASYSDETWEWDGVTWQNISTPGPGARWAPIVYDSQRDRVVLFGGAGGVGDTWEWDGSTWSEVVIPGPAARSNHAMTYDSIRGVTVLFGGTVSGDETWEYDGSVWSLVAPGGSGPSARHDPAMAFDAHRGVTVLFSGGFSGADTWEWDGVSWSLVDSGSGPGDRQYASMVYSPRRRAVLMHGDTPLGETWQWDGSTWVLLPAVGPSRAEHGGTYDVQRRAFTFFGGKDGMGAFQGDTWRLPDPAMDAALVTPSLANPATGSQVAACLHIDLTESGRTLGSYGATLTWDPAVLEYLDYTGGDPPFDVPIVNTDDVATGSLAIADADPTGLAGDPFLFCAEFDVLGVAGTSSALDLELTSAFEAGTFEDLLPGLEVLDATIDVVLECTVGDVNGDTFINSGDALIVLSDEIGLPIPAEATERIAARCGDANGDGVTDSIDANVILTWEVGLPTDPGFPIGGSNQTFDDCPVCGVLTLCGMDDEVVLADGWIYAGIKAQHPSVIAGQSFHTALVMELSVADETLGSYGATLTWDPTRVRYVGMRGGLTEEFSAPLVNDAEAAAGRLRFTEANPTGATGRVNLIRVRFEALEDLPRVRDEIRLDFTSLGSIGPDFENLMPYLQVR